MKKTIILILVMALIFALALTGCGKKSPEQKEESKQEQKEETIQTIEFDGLKIVLPGQLELNSTMSGDNYRTYEKREDNKQVESLMITSIDSVVKFGEYYTREDAAKTMKELNSNIDSRSEVSNPSIELGGFGDKYDLISITYKETIADMESYVKYAYVYFDDRTFAFTYKNDEKDFSTFDEIMKSGSYTSGSGSDNTEKKDSDSGMMKISGGGASTIIPKEWKYSESKSNDNAKYYIGSDFRFVYSFADTGSTITNQKLGELTNKVLESSGDQYKGLAYHDYIVGDGIPANIVYVDKAESGIGRYERLVVFASGTNVIFIAGDSADNNFDDFEMALKNIKIG